MTTRREVFRRAACRRPWVIAPYDLHEPSHDRETPGHRRGPARRASPCRRTSSRRSPCPPRASRATPTSTSTSCTPTRRSRGRRCSSRDVSRYVVDLNRAEDDVDAESVEGGPAGAARPARGHLAAQRRRRAGLRAPRSPRAELERRLDDVPPPVPRRAAAPRGAEARAVRRRRHPRRPLDAEPRALGARASVGPARADVVPGTRGRDDAPTAGSSTPSRRTRGRAGWSVRHDDPYRGGFTTSHYGRPARASHAVQVELARRHYMDEERLVPCTHGSTMYEHGAVGWWPSSGSSRYAKDSTDGQNAVPPGQPRAAPAWQTEAARWPRPSPRRRCRRRRCQRRPDVSRRACRP